MSDENNVERAINIMLKTMTDNPRWDVMARAIEVLEQSVTKKQMKKNRLFMEKLFGTRNP